MIKIMAIVIIAIKLKIKIMTKVGTVTKMRDRLTASPPVLSPQPSAEQVFLI